MKSQSPNNQNTSTYGPRNKGDKRQQRGVHFMEQEQTTPHIQNFTDLFTLAVMDGLETANMDPNLDCAVDLYIALSRGDKKVNSETLQFRSGSMFAVSSPSTTARGNKSEKF